jgi:dihydrofolate synthase/folylpolyglutamate synthase
MKQNLTDWLSYIESLHPKSIEMGLERVKAVMARLQLTPSFHIITVAGTNGKGSTTAILEKIYTQAGYRVGCYTSPHLLSYNERVRVNHQEANDDALCEAFSAVEKARVVAGNVIELTYFEFGTLAAIWHFMQAHIEVAILEIGLGGRLDAVNAFESDCAIVTNVDLDHQDYLGYTREAIGFEKAGVYRTAKPAICGDSKPPQSLIAHAQAIQADFKCIHEAFDFTVHENFWVYDASNVSGAAVHYQLPFPALIGTYQFNNAACAITAVVAMQSRLPVEQSAIAQALKQVRLAGRFEVIPASVNADAFELPLVIFDVAHNPHAARALASNLSAFTHQQHVKKTKTVAVFAMLNDKDIAGVVQALQDEIDVWYVASIAQPRGATASDIAKIIKSIIPNALVKTFEEAALAYQAAIIEHQAYKAAHENVKIVVFGSFFTVARVKQFVLQSSAWH